MEEIECVLFALARMHEASLLFATSVFRLRVANSSLILAEQSQIYIFHFLLCFAIAFVLNVARKRWLTDTHTTHWITWRPCLKWVLITHTQHQAALQSQRQWRWRRHRSPDDNDCYVKIQRKMNRTRARPLWYRPLSAIIRRTIDSPRRTFPCVHTHTHSEHD